MCRDDEFRNDEEWEGGPVEFGEYDPAAFGVEWSLDDSDDDVLGRQGDFFDQE